MAQALMEFVGDDNEFVATIAIFSSAAAATAAASRTFLLYCYILGPSFLSHL